MSQSRGCEGGILCKRLWGLQPSYAVVFRLERGWSSHAGYSSPFLGYLS